MIVLAKKQKNSDGTPHADWMQARCGRVTASRLGDVMNFLKQTKAEAQAGVLNEGAKRIGYRAELIAERLTAMPAEHFVSSYMKFGADYEADARQAYELQREVMVDQLGFVRHPSFDFAGASPDGLVGDEGGLEIKVPKTETHLSYLLADVVPEEYKPQMYFGMICCERWWWDFCSYDPRLPKELRLFTKRLVWDEVEAQRINAVVQGFHESIEASIAYLRERFGNFTLPAQMKRETVPSGEGYLTDADFEGLV